MTYASGHTRQAQERVLCGPVILEFFMHDKKCFLRVLQMAHNDLLKSCRAVVFHIKWWRVLMRSSTSSVFYISYSHIYEPSQKKERKKIKSKTMLNSIHIGEFFESQLF